MVGLMKLVDHNNICYELFYYLCYNKFVSDVLCYHMCYEFRNIVVHKSKWNKKILSKGLEMLSMIDKGLIEIDVINKGAKLKFM